MLDFCSLCINSKPLIQLQFFILKVGKFQFTTYLLVAMLFLKSKILILLYIQQQFANLFLLSKSKEIPEGEMQFLQFSWYHLRTRYLIVN